VAGHRGAHTILYEDDAGNLQVLPAAEATSDDGTPMFPDAEMPPAQTPTEAPETPTVADPARAELDELRRLAAQHDAGDL
jgi:hypothetical protein